MYDKLIYGKNPIEKVVSVEIDEDQAIVFTEDEEGIKRTVLPHKYWYLQSKPGANAIKLHGSLHYQYGKQFKERNSWSQALAKLRKTGQDFFTIYDHKEAFLVKDGVTYFKGLKHTDPSALAFDIESTGLHRNESSKVLLISNTFRKNGNIIRKLFAYDEYESQADLIVAWCDWVREMDPSLLIGHNCYTYDLPYLNHVANMHGVDLKLGRDGSDTYFNTRPSQFRVDGSRSQEYHKVRVWGREVVDTMFLAIKYDTASKKYNSYGLKSIIKQEGLEKENRVHYDSSKIRFNYTNYSEWKLIKEYCEHDADDALALYDLMSPSLFYMTQIVPKSFQSMLESATGSQINTIMIRSYLQEGHSIPKADPVKAFPGAISRGKPGIYKNCIRWDVSSLYPSIMLQYKVFDEEKDPNCNFLKILEKLTKQRLEYKRIAKETKDPYYEGLQSSVKIAINSFYGFLAAPGLQFNSVECADFVTATGRKILSIAVEWATGSSFENWDKSQ